MSLLFRNNNKNRPLSVKTFDEVPVGKDKVLSEVNNFAERGKKKKTGVSTFPLSKIIEYSTSVHNHAIYCRS